MPMSGRGLFVSWVPDVDVGWRRLLLLFKVFCSPAVLVWLVSYARRDWYGRVPWVVGFGSGSVPVGVADGG